MPTKFVPLELGLIHQGRLLASAEAKLAQLQQDLIAYVAKNGPSAKKAKGELTIKIVLSCEQPPAKDQTAAYGIMTAISVNNPQDPPQVSVALGGETQDARPALFVQTTGSKRDTPLQGVLCGDEGENLPSQ